MLEGDDSGYPYPISSKVVQRVLTELRIQQAIEENRLAIEQIQIPGALTFNDIWGMGFVNTEWVNQRIEATERVLTALDIWNMGFITGDWVEEQGYMTESQIQALIGSVGVLTFDDIWDLGYRDETWVNDNFIHKDILIADYVRKTQLGITPLTLINGDSFRTDTLNGFLTKTWRDGKTYPNDQAIAFLMNETLGLDNSKLDRNEFNDFLKTGVTPEFMDLVAGSLMDVDVEGIKSDLNDALANRPTYDDIGSGRLFLPGGYWSTLQDQMGGLWNMQTCFKGSASGLKKMVSSLESDIDDVKVNFDEIKNRMDDVKDDCKTLKDFIQNWLAHTGVDISMGSLVTGLKELMAELRDFVGSGGDYSGLHNNFIYMKSEFGKASDSLEMLSNKANDLKTCGESKLDW